MAKEPNYGAMSAGMANFGDVGNPFAAIGKWGSGVSDAFWNLMMRGTLDPAEAARIQAQQVQEAQTFRGPQAPATVAALAGTPQPQQGQAPVMGMGDRLQLDLPMDNTGYLPPSPPSVVSALANQTPVEGVPPMIAKPEMRVPDMLKRPVGQPAPAPVQQSNQPDWAGMQKDRLDAMAGMQGAAYEQANRSPIGNSQADRQRASLSRFDQRFNQNWDAQHEQGQAGRNDLIMPTFAGGQRIGDAVQGGQPGEAPPMQMPSRNDMMSNYLNTMSQLTEGQQLNLIDQSKGIAKRTGAQLGDESVIAALMNSPLWKQTQPVR